MNAKITSEQLALEHQKRRAGNHPKTDPKKGRTPIFMGGLAQSVNDACQRWLEARGLAIPSADYRLGTNLAINRAYKAHKAKADAERQQEHE